MEENYSDLIPYIKLMPPDNNAHRIIHVGLLELVLDINGEYFLR